MGTIAEKLEYLHNTKTGIRSALNLKLSASKQIASNATFRSFINSIGQIEIGEDVTTGFTGIKAYIISDDMSTEIQDVAIVITNTTTQESYNLTSNDNGRAYAELDAGSYSVSVTAPSGFAFTQDTQSVTLSADEVESVYFYMGVDSVTYGVKIDLADSEPTTSVSYTDGAVGFNPSYSDFNNSNAFVDNGWNDRFPFNQMKPCLFKNGAVVKYLNPNNYAQDIDGNSVDITSGSAGDVMIEIPKVYYKLSNDANYQYVQISDSEQDGFCCYAHKYQGVEKDKVYIGAYHGYYDGTSLRSLSGKAPTATQNITIFRNYAQANGAGYQQFYFHLMTLLQCLYVIRFKSLDSQSKLGYGWCKVSTTIAATNTGGADTKGLNYGESGTAQIKFCGIEDFYGNVLNWVDGAVTDASRNILIFNADSSTCVYNNTGTGYKTTTTGFTSNQSGYVIKVWGTNDAGFTLKTKGGSATTYYCDNGLVDASKVCSFGGSYNSATYYGAFYVYLYYSATSAFASIGGRLAFC